MVWEERKTDKVHLFKKEKKQSDSHHQCYEHLGSPNKDNHRHQKLPTCKDPKIPYVRTEEKRANELLKYNATSGKRSMYRSRSRAQEKRQ